MHRQPVSRTTTAQDLLAADPAAAAAQLEALDTDGRAATLAEMCLQVRGDADNPLHLLGRIGWKRYELAGPRTAFTRARWSVSHTLGRRAALPASATSRDELAKAFAAIEDPPVALLALHTLDRGAGDTAADVISMIDHAAELGGQLDEQGHQIAAALLAEAPDMPAERIVDAAQALAIRRPDR